MTCIKTAVIGWGNVGKYAAQAILAAPDMALCGVVRRDASREAMPGVVTVGHVSELDSPDAAVLCVPTRKAGDMARELLSMGLNTVDSFDIHEQILSHRQALDETAKRHGTKAVVAAGWDPGTDSVARTLMEAMTPKGITITDFGPGMSMGHSVAAKAVEGVTDALSLTLPAGAGVHRRVVYISLEDGADFDAVAKAIKADPYFASDETTVLRTDNVDDLLDFGHGVRLTRKGVSGGAHNQRLEFSMRINNPALTAQIMVSCVRAAGRAQPGAYTLIELPPVDLLCGAREDAVGRLV